jgi:hypothetical protein
VRRVVQPSVTKPKGGRKWPICLLLSSQMLQAAVRRGRSQHIGKYFGRNIYMVPSHFYVTVHLWFDQVRWSACSLQRFASVKWIPCRLVAQCVAVGSPRREGVARPERRPDCHGEIHAAIADGVNGLK